LVKATVQNKKELAKLPSIPGVRVLISLLVYVAAIWWLAAILLSAINKYERFSLSLPRIFAT
jgi:hypothetical protein